MNIKCASLNCIYNDDKGYCRYDGTILISEHNVHTVHNGFQQYHECKRYDDGLCKNEVTE